ncbi:MAG: hypothetical protein P8M30_02880 [Planctomycetaceae bacterium]|jgi:cellulose synthase operon protein C|nr:hypothetical protein [Planctomycetaceae bacterium]
MKRHLFCLIAVIFGVCVQSLHAEEPYLELIQAMRNRGFSDTALDYIEELRTRNDLPDDVKARLSFEEFRVHQQSARLAKTVELKQAALEKALASLERFAKESPNHPLAGSANSERAGIFLDKAKALIWESRSEKNVAKKKKQQEEARGHITKARDVYQTARDQFEKAYAAFKGQFLDEKKDEEKYKTRKDAEQNFIQAQFDLALCSYQEARTFDDGSQPYLAGLSKAAEQFEAIHSKYRSQGAGLYSRIMQGKCFEEQAELGRALGIYDELLGHPGESDTMKMLKSQTFFFKLIVLNKPEKSDHKLVVSEATKWLQENRRESKTSYGLGIQWERALALEILGSQGDLPKEEQQGYLESAFSEARELALYAGEFRDPATAMVQRLEPLVSGESGDPKNFGGALSVAKNKVRQHADFSKKVKAAQNDSQKQAAEAAFDLHLKETERIIRLGLSLIEGGEKPGEIASMQYFLAFTLYYAKKQYDAAAVADFIVRTASEEQAIQAQDAAYLALGALSQIYYAKPDAQRDAEREMMSDAASLLASRWPESGKADDARLILGDIYRGAGEPLEAVKYFNAVNDTHPRHQEAVLKAGQELWVAYLRELQKLEVERLEKAKLDDLAAQAEKRIKEGMVLVEKGLSSEGTPTDIYVLAKVTLVEILNAKGQEVEALKLLTEGDHNIIKHVSVENEANRPPRGPKSRPVAIQVYQLLLRTYMGSGNLDEAIKTMDELEVVAGSDNLDALTQIYIQLGFKLKEEIDRLRAEGNQERLDTVLTSFDGFLGALTLREESLDYSKLLWIAESYANLGDGVQGDPSASAAYYDKAASAYDKIMEKGKGDADFIDPAYLPSINTRIAVLQKRQGDYEAAFKTIVEVLAGNAKQLDAQMEAALILKEWAEISGDNQKYLDAVMGNKQKDQTITTGTSVYGFGQLGLLIQQVMSNPNSTIPNIRERYYDVLYEMGDSLYQYGKSLSGEEQKDFFVRAKSTLYQFALNSTPDVDNETWTKFDTLYLDVQNSLGEIPTPLERPTAVAGTDGQPVQTQESIDEELRNADAGDGGEVIITTVDEPTGPNYMLAAIAVLVCAGMGVGLFFLIKPKKKARRRIPGRDDDTPVTIGAPSAVPANKAAAQPRPQKQAAPQIETKPATAPPAKSQQAEKPKAKPQQQPAPTTKPAAESAPADQPVKKRRTVADLTPEEKAALKKKILAKKKAEAAKAAETKKSEDS